MVGAHLHCMLDHVRGWEFRSVMLPVRHGGVRLQVLQEHAGAITIKELSERTSIRADDVVKTLTHLQLIQVQKGVHVLYAGPSIIARCASVTACVHVCHA